MPPKNKNSKSSRSDQAKEDSGKNVKSTAQEPSVEPAMEDSEEKDAIKSERSHGKKEQNGVAQKQTGKNAKTKSGKPQDSNQDTATDKDPKQDGKDVDQEDVKPDTQQEDDAIDEPDDKTDQPGQKRERQTRSQTAGAKKQKTNTGNAEDTQSDQKESKKDSKKGQKETVGSKHDDAAPPAEAGSTERLPEVGSRVAWKSLPGWVYGKVIEIVTESKTVQGKQVKGSKDNPRIVLETDNGKIAVHKPEACHFK